MPGNNPGVLPAFFPLLPLLIRAMATVLHGFRAPLPLPISEADSSVLLAGVLISHALSLLAFWLLYRLAYEETDDEGTARRAALYTAIFPLAFYYAVPYTEALFLAASVGTFLAARRGYWLQAGLCAAIASAARLAGVLLLPVLMLEIGLAWQHGEMHSHAWPRALLGLLLAPAGLLLYMLYLSRYTGDPLAFLHAQANWNREQVFPPVTLWRGISYAFHPSWSPNLGIYGRGVMNTVIVLGFLLVTVVSLCQWRPSYVLYGVLLFTLSLLSPLKGAATMQSVGRYVMVFFPVYFTLAHWGRRPSINLTILLICLPLLSLFTALYVSWYFLG
jgi:Gpi18-like mannosyltransferase